MKDPDTKPDRLSVAAVIGLSQSGADDWSAVQGARYALLSKRIFARQVLHLAGMVLVFSQLHTSVSWAVLGAWAAALFGVIA